MIAQDDLTEEMKEIERLHQEINKLTANYRHLQQEYDTYKSNNEQELASRRGYTDTEELSKAISTLEEQVNSYKIKYDEATEQALSTKSSLINYMRTSNERTRSLHEKIEQYDAELKNTRLFVEKHKGLLQLCLEHIDYDFKVTSSSCGSLNTSKV